MTGPLEFSPRTIAAEWKREGRTYRPRDVTDEYMRRGREVVRDRESAILVAAAQPDATEGIREVAEQIRDHRAAGNYTTQG